MFDYSNIKNTFINLFVLLQVDSKERKKTNV